MWSYKNDEIYVVYERQFNGWIFSEHQIETIDFFMDVYSPFTLATTACFLYSGFKQRWKRIKQGVPVAIQ